MYAQQFQQSTVARKEPLQCGAARFVHPDMNDQSLFHGCLATIPKMYLLHCSRPAICLPH